jgi:hypothetical protein
LNALSDLSAMTFPILCLDQKYKNVSSFSNAEAVSVCTALALKKGGFQNGTYFDSDGREFKVTKAEWPPEATGFQGWLRSLRNPLIKAKLTFTETGNAVALDDLRQQVLAFLEADRDFYEESGDYSQLRGRVLRSGNYRDLISCFLGR